MKTNKGLTWDNEQGQLGHLYRHVLTITAEYNQHQATARLMIDTTGANVINSLEALANTVALHRTHSATGCYSDGTARVLTGIAISSATAISIEYFNNGLKQFGFPSTAKIAVTDDFNSSSKIF